MGFLLALALLFLSTKPCRADLVLALHTPAVDPASLLPGQVFSVEVVLSGLRPGDSVDFLAATVRFPDSLLGTPTINGGEIVPDLSGFRATAFPGLADANYDILFGLTPAPIVGNGVFFSFLVTPQQTGTGPIAFDFVDSIGQDGQGVPLPAVTASGPLSFTVRAAPATSVAEPSSLVLAAVVAAAAGLVRRWRGRWANPGQRIPRLLS